MAATQIKNGYHGGSDDQLLVNPDGSINVDASLVPGSNVVRIEDTAGNALTSTDGALNVNIAQPGTPLALYNAVSDVAMNATATVISYTVPVGKTLLLNRVNVSSDSISSFEFDINAATNAVLRIGYATSYNPSLDYGGFALVAGTTITLTGTNNSLQGAATFNTTILGSLV